MKSIATGALQRFRTNPAFACALLLALASILVYVLPWIWAVHTLIAHELMAVNLADRDFVNYWLAARATLEGSTPKLFVHDTYFQYLQQVFGEGREVRSWSYPPHMLLFLWPLGFLEYQVAMLVFLAVTLAAFIAAVAVFRANVAPRSDVVIVGLALFAYALMQVDATQNGFLTGTWLLLGLAWMKHRPVLAGLAFACLTVKPQLGFVIPVLLLFDRNWRTILWAGVFTLVLVGVSLILFGVGSWHAYLVDTLAYQRSVMTDWYGIFLAMMPTVFGSARVLGFSPEVATLVQWPVSIAAGALLIWLLRTNTDPLERIFAVLGCVFLITPYAFNYDMGALSAAAAMLASAPSISRNRAAAILMAALAALPAIVTNLGRAGLPIAPLLLALALATIASRTRGQR